MIKMVACPFTRSAWLDQAYSELRNQVYGQLREEIDPILYIEIYAYFHGVLSDRLGTKLRDQICWQLRKEATQR